MCGVILLFLNACTIDMPVKMTPTPLPVTPTFTDTPVIVNTPTHIITTPTPKRLGRVTVSDLNVRACPNGNVIDVIHEGQEVTILAEKTIDIPNVCKVWYNIVYNKKAGWACAEFIE